MENVRTVFSLNHEIIYFGYGLVFFILGLAIALQSRSYSRLDLARSLKWLAAFGFTHGLHEWGDLFIPIQAQYLGPTAFVILHWFHLLLLAGSFAFLCHFGTALVRPMGRWHWLRGTSAGLFVVWAIAVFFPLRLLLPGFTEWHDTADAIARYFIGFPGALLAAYGLRQHSIKRIVPLHVPHIVRMLQFAGTMLAWYSVFSGLIGPPVGFFPGNLINAVTVEQVVGVPPPVFRSLIGLGLTVAIIRALEVFNLETARVIESMEQRQILAAERNRIARELHDGAIQKVYTAGLLVESAQNLTREGSRLSARLGKAANVLNDAISDLRRSLDELHSAPVEEPFDLALRKLAGEPRFRSLVDVSLNLDLPASASLSPVRADHVLAIVSEALSNVIRHSHASQVKIGARYKSGRLIVRVEDDGVGLPRDVEAGYGLRNMRDRARLLGGQIGLSSTGGRGTVVTLDIPWKDDR